MGSALDTIYALSTGSLPSGVAIVRVSGPKAKEAVASFGVPLPKPRVATLRMIKDVNSLPLDSALLLYFPAPNSFTGEDVLEIHLHGGRAVVQAVLQHLAGLPELRVAEAGEFTRRAFDNNRLDLVEVEGLSDLLRAETEMQRRLAMEQTRGAQSQLYQRWMTDLTRCRAMIEAELDFSEEEDIPESVSAQTWPIVIQIASEIRRHLEGQNAAEIIRDGYNCVIVGRPNAGKSSLINYLSKRDVAIVTDFAGTTRDLLTVDLDLAGYLVRLTDTAGLRIATDVVEAHGIERARLAARNADLILYLRDWEDPLPYEDIDSDAKRIYISTKCDSLVEDDRADLSISVKQGWGIGRLLAEIQSTLQSQAFGGVDVLPARERHAALLREALGNIERSVECNVPLEISSELLRRAAHSLGKITGFVDTEDLLGVIFGEFCVGK